MDCVTGWPINREEAKAKRAAGDGLEKRLTVGAADIGARTRVDSSQGIPGVGLQREGHADCRVPVFKFSRIVA
jgi:hypothetical protein